MNSVLLSPNSIVIIMPNWVGDVVMATPLIEAIHDLQFDSYPTLREDHSEHALFARRARHR